MPTFVPGIQLCRSFFEEAVRPILQRQFPNLEYGAGLIGSGSEVLGFDDEMSSDHHWGPRVMLFLREDDFKGHRNAINAALGQQLPKEFLGYSTNFSEPDPNDNNVQRLEPIEIGPVNHRVEIFTIRGYLLSYLNFDIDREIEAADWLSFPEQKLLSITSGDVFEDRIGLEAARERFSYYPHDVWLYLLASAWNRIGQEEHLMGRAGIVGDEIGSALIASRLVRDIMRLCFLMEKRYAPYPKWFGTAFRGLACAERLTPHLETVLRSTTWQEREKHLVSAYEIIAAMYNNPRSTEPLPIKAGDFFDRPFKVIELTGGFSNAILSQISDPDVKRIAANKLIGSIDQISDNTNILLDPRWRLSVRRLFE